MTPVSYYFIDDRIYPSSSEISQAEDSDSHIYWHFSKAPDRVIATADQVLRCINIGSISTRTEIDSALKKLEKDGSVAEMLLSFVYGLDLISYAHSKGFLIMGVTIPYSRDSQIQALLLKFHTLRAVIPLNNRDDHRDLIRHCLNISDVPTDLAEDSNLWGLPVIHQCHIKQARKGNLKLYVNKDPAKCIGLCEASHQPTWLHQGILMLYRAWNSEDGSKGGTRLISVEVYRGEELIAGEIGVVYKTMYTSLTGFTLEKNSGMIQLLTWFCVLLKRGFEIWDFGMVMDYKSRMGAYTVRSGDWAKIVTHCSSQAAPASYSIAEGIDCAACLYEQKYRRQVQKND